MVHWKGAYVTERTISVLRHRLPTDVTRVVPQAVPRRSSGTLKNRKTSLIGIEPTMTSLTPICLLWRPVMRMRLMPSLRTTSHTWLNSMKTELIWFSHACDAWRCGCLHIYWSTVSLQWIAAWRHYRYIKCPDIRKVYVIVPWFFLLVVL